MHSIERYGIVALLFLVVTVVAVLMWDGGKEKKKDLVGAVSPPAAQAARPPADAAGRRLSLVADSQPGPLTRQGRRAERELARAAENALPPGESELPRTLPGEADASEPAPEGAASPASSAKGAALPSQTPPEQPAREEVVGQLPAGGSHAYRVQPGDTLSEIAQRELGSARRWKDLVAANPGLDPSRLQAGKTIRIPGGKASAGATSPAAAPVMLAAQPGGAKAQAAPARTWTVKNGESLWKIAQQALGDGKRWREIAALNPKMNPDRLVLGQVLVLPAAKGAPRTAPAAAPDKKSAASAPVVASRQAPANDTRRGGKVK